MSDMITVSNLHIGLNTLKLREQNLIIFNKLKNLNCSIPRFDVLLDQPSTTRFHRQCFIRMEIMTEGIELLKDFNKSHMIWGKGFASFDRYSWVSYSGQPHLQ
ncbi:hypothetical protein RchiOBHm_Chr7g0203131 [Rosa chinensis]|uniref:Uncharacterized protein n=1 Tax=Rosa chinensis TaxID=74649 RepID=A0A2P6P8C4_ROSCH|nr:hypothetical protein RchiOBHm_Chr7g0203131 [Rosa chinensis]